MAKKKGAFFYAVKNGRQKGVFLTWEECEAQVKAFNGAKYKKFATLHEAEAFVSGSSSEVLTSTAVVVSETQASSSSSSSRTRTSITEAAVDEAGWDVVYSDGACKGNGQPGSIAGIGVWWGPNDSRNLYERSPGLNAGDQTNNRAELTAIVRLLEETPLKKKPLMIKTDSKYSIACVKEYLPKWERNGWRTADGKPVKNVPLIRYLSALLHLRAFHGQQVRLEYVKGHAGIEGNEGADAMANLGATLPAVAEPDWDEKRAEVEKHMEGGVRKRVLEDEEESPIKKAPSSSASKRAKLQDQDPKPKPSDSDAFFAGDLWSPEEIAEMTKIQRQNAEKQPDGGARKRALEEGETRAEKTSSTSSPKRAKLKDPDPEPNEVDTFSEADLWSPEEIAEMTRTQKFE